MTTNKTIKISALARQNNVTGKMIIPVSFLDYDNVYKSATIDVEAITNFVSNNLDYVTSTDLSESIMQIIDGAPEKLDTLKEIAEYINTDTANAAELSNKVTALENAGFITEHQDLSHLALKTDIPSLEGYVREEDLREPNLEAYATKAFVKSQGYLTEHQDLSHLALKSDIPTVPSIEGLATEEYVDNAIAGIEIPEIPNLDGYATAGEVGTLKMVQNMLVDTISTWSKTEGEPQSIAGKIKTANDAQNEYIAANYALKSDIPEVPSLDGYAKLEDLNNISAPDLSKYALKSEIPSTTGFTSVNSSNNLIKDSSTVTQLTIGSGLQSPNNNCLTVGRYNSSSSAWNAMFWVGSGTSTSSRKNQMIVQENQLHYRGELKEASGWIGDFGEYFEWNDGNPKNEDRIGYMVQLNGDKIELAESIENCIGIISDTCIITGGGCSFEWHNMYLRDDFGRELKDENGNSIVNPEYNPDVEYISRDKRQEWDKVGILGQIHTRQDGTLKVGGFAGCENGVATNAETGYRVLRIINENVAVLLVK